MADIQPMEQFLIKKLVTLPAFNVGGVTVDLSITNSVATMIFAAALITVFFLAAGAARSCRGACRRSARSSTTWPTRA